MENSHDFFFNLRHYSTNYQTLVQGLAKPKSELNIGFKNTDLG